MRPKKKKKMNVVDVEMFGEDIVCRFVDENLCVEMKFL